MGERPWLAKALAGLVGAALVCGLVIGLHEGVLPAIFRLLAPRSDNNIQLGLIFIMTLPALGFAEGMLIGVPERFWPGLESATRFSLLGGFLAAGIVSSRSLISVATGATAEVVSGALTTHLVAHYLFPCFIALVGLDVMRQLSERRRARRADPDEPPAPPSGSPRRATSR
jgi:hypothetical protein